MAAATTLVPALGWLRSHERGWPRYDLMAGGDARRVPDPAAIGDASLAGQRQANETRAVEGDGHEARAGVGDALRLEGLERLPGPISPRATGE